MPVARMERMLHRKPQRRSPERISQSQRLTS
jgi:hypothetical protein